MKHCLKFILFLILIILAVSTFAQTAKDLIEEGLQLSNAKNYAAAIEKYKAALANDTANTTAKYQLAFALNATGKGVEALPYFKEVLKANSSTAVLQSSYTIMAGIYDRLGQAPNAISNYKLAIGLDSADYALHYGLGLAYFRNKQYSQAEQSAINAITLAPSQPANLRLYGLVTFHQNERASALLSLCRYLYLAPNGNRAEEAYSNVQSILQGGRLKLEAGVKPPKPGAESLELNQAITDAVKEVEKRRYFAPADKFTEQLQAIFAAIGSLAQKQTGNRFFRTQLAARFYKLSQSGHMPAFARYISQSQDKSAATWIASHGQVVEAMKKWTAEN
ncbi:tetratricopeptide repeat protein [Mucilaginibacter terrae]|uniref:Tetratricopeptide (TPR) repeat protein n=1 Tax=Mucilaginibacter terrae TaxID=1955052 RepID=A0ABU3GWM6_9SPHI|nr:tetratricopeptide repeat protein [Mucilaginibacter terrae]MDT3403881.1 tetratricopeptide (TPR) repeat protein [Mucilaginibacter terrae]